MIDAGDPACWMHDVCAECGTIHDGDGGCLRVTRSASAGSRGVASEQLNATVVTLAPGTTLARARVDRDVALTAIAGRGTLSTWRSEDAPAVSQPLEPGSVVVLPHGSWREIVAGEAGLAWSSVHRRREGLDVGATR